MCFLMCTYIMTIHNKSLQIEWKFEAFILILNSRFPHVFHINLFQIMHEVSVRAHLCEGFKHDILFCFSI